MKKIFTNEFKTGIAVLASIFLLVGVLYKTGDLSFKNEGYQIYSDFDYSGGVKVHAPVQLAGIHVGEVKNLELVYEDVRTFVRTTLWIRSDVRIREDALAQVSSLGLMGEKYIEINTGSSAAFIEEGAVIASKDPISMEDVLEDVSSTVKHFGVMAKNANELIVDSKPKLSRIFTSLDGILGHNRPKLDRIMDNIEETSEYFKEFSEDIKHHPWKVLAKGKEKTPEELEKYRLQRKIRKLKDAGKYEEAEALMSNSSGSSSRPQPTTKDRNKGFLVF